MIDKLFKALWRMFTRSPRTEIEDISHGFASPEECPEPPPGFTDRWGRTGRNGHIVEMSDGSKGYVARAAGKWG